MQILYIFEESSSLARKDSAKYEKKYLKTLDIVFMLYPRKHFNFVSKLLLVWYDFATSDSVKSALKQRCVCCQCWNLQRWAMSNQRCLFQHWY